MDKIFRVQTVSPDPFSAGHPAWFWLVIAGQQAGFREVLSQTSGCWRRKSRKSLYVIKSHIPASCVSAAASQDEY